LWVLIHKEILVQNKEEESAEFVFITEIRALMHCLENNIYCFGTSSDDSMHITVQ